MKKLAMIAIICSILATYSAHAKVELYVINNVTIGATTEKGKTLMQGRAKITTTDEKREKREDEVKTFFRKLELPLNNISTIKVGLFFPGLEEPDKQYFLKTDRPLKTEDRLVLLIRPEKAILYSKKGTFFPMEEWKVAKPSEKPMIGRQRK